MRSLVYRKSILLFALFLLFVFLSNSPAVSEDKSTSKNNKTSKIRITSNRMKAVSKAKYAEFAGNVKAVQGDFILTSDVLRIYYAESSTKEKKPIKKGSISKIIARGNVHINFEDCVAVSDIALYLTEQMVIILKGGNSKITCGENSIVGTKITYYRTDGRFKVEGTPDKRVVAVFYSRKNEKGDYSIIPSSKDKEELPSEPGKPVVEKDIKD